MPGNYVDPKSLVDASKISPYIATFNPKLTIIPAKELKSHEIVGAMVYGGSYFDVQHSVRRFYRSDNLKIQVNQLDDAKIPYAMYVSVRASNVEEAKKECNALWYVVSKYPPKLGLWLRIETRKPKGITNQILEQYYTYITKWGMKDNCGLYVKSSDFDYFSWEQFYERFFLWYVDPVNSMQDIYNKLLTPEFFQLKGH